MFLVNVEKIKEVLIKNIIVAEDTFFEVLLGRVAKEN